MEATGGDVASFGVDYWVIRQKAEEILHWSGGVRGPGEEKGGGGDEFKESEEEEE